MLVSIIIPTLFSHPDYLVNCLNSLKKQSFLDFAITIVCNTSQKVKEDFCRNFNFGKLQISWLILGQNYGFAKAVNVGIKKSESQLIALLNDDVEVDQDWLKNLVLAQKQSGADMVASKIYKLGSKKIDSLGFTFLFRGRSPAITNLENSSLRKEKDYWLNNREFFPKLVNKTDFFHEPFGPDAAACLYTNEVLNEIGLFDESFFAYLEDVDLALRARLQANTCVLAENAVAYHHKHATSQKMTGFKKKQDFKNWWKIVFKYQQKNKIFRSKIWKKFLGLIIIERIKNLKGLIINE